jgi:hypothetical protein
MLTLSAILLTTPLMLWGLAASSMPFVAHLLNRRAQQRITFPTIRFLQQAAASQSRLFRFRRWVLLALRCLAIAAIAAAFTRPMWSSSLMAAPSSDSRVSLIIVIDASASAAQRPGGETLMAREIAAAQRLLTDPAIQSANVIYAGAKPRPAFTDLVPNVDALSADVSRAQPTQERADLLAAVALASDMLASRGGDLRIALLSDMQKTNWDELIARGGLAGLAQKNIHLTLIPIDAPPAANLALSRPRSIPARPVVGPPARLVVTVTNFSDHPQTAAVSLSIDGSPAGSARAVLEPWQQQDLAIEATFPAAARHQAIFTLPDDDLAADNRVNLVVESVARVPILLIADDNPADPTGSSYYITRALAPRGDSSGFDVRRAPAAMVTAASLQNTEAVILGESTRLGDPAAAAIRDYVAAGGGLLMFCGEGPVPANALALQHAAGKEPLLPWLPTMIRDFADDENAAIVDGAWSSTALAAFDEASQHALAAIRFNRRYTVSEPLAGAVSLLRYDSASPALSVQNYRRGRVMLASFSPTPRWGDLVKHGSFVALLHGLVSDLRPRLGARPPAVVGQTLSLPVDPAALDPDAPPIRVTAPTGNPAAAQTIHSRDHDEAILDRIDSAGFYAVDQGPRRLALVAANVDERESDLRRIEPGVLAALKESNPLAVETAAEASAMGPAGRPLWPHLVVAAMALLGLEMLLLNMWKR